MPATGSSTGLKPRFITDNRYKGGSLTANGLRLPSELALHQSGALSWWMLIYAVPLKLVMSLVRAVKRGYIRDLLRVLREVNKELPALWKQRQPIRTETARRYLQLQRQHGPLRWI
jgi:hypothetical protein